MPSLTDQPVQINTKELAKKKIMKVPANQFVSSDIVTTGRVKSGQLSLLQNATEGIKANTHFQSNFFTSVFMKQEGKEEGKEGGRR